MNWTDIFVLAIILGFGYFGFRKGLMLSLLKLASFFIAVLVAVKFSPFVAKILAGTFIFTKIKSGIYGKLMLQQDAQMSAVNEGAAEAAESMVDGLKLPGFLKNLISDKVAEKMPNVGELIDYASIADKISDVLANFVTTVISVILLYIVARITLIFARSILKKVSRLPVLKQADKLGGFALGAIEGLLTIYIIFAILMLFHATPLFKGFFESIETSAVAKYFYENNFIVSWIFPKG